MSLTMMMMSSLRRGCALWSRQHCMPAAPCDWPNLELSIAPSHSHGLSKKYDRPVFRQAHSQPIKEAQPKVLKPQQREKLKRKTLNRKASQQRIKCAERMLLDFVDSFDLDSIRLPNDLNMYERRVLSKMADQYDLRRWTVDTEDKMQMVIWRRGTADPRPKIHKRAKPKNCGSYNEDKTPSTSLSGEDLIADMNEAVLRKLCRGSRRRRRFAHVLFNDFIDAPNTSQMKDSFSTNADVAQLTGLIFNEYALSTEDQEILLEALKERDILISPTLAYGCIYNQHLASLVMEDRRDEAENFVTELTPVVDVSKDSLKLLNCKNDSQILQQLRTRQLTILARKNSPVGHEYMWKLYNKLRGDAHDSLIRLEQPSFNVMLSQCVNDSQREQVLSDMQANRHSLCQTTLSTLLQHFVIYEDNNAIEKTLQTLRQTCEELNPVVQKQIFATGTTHDALTAKAKLQAAYVKRCLRRGKIGYLAAWELYSKLQSAGAMIPPEIHISMLQGCRSGTSQIDNVVNVALDRSDPLNLPPRLFTSVFERMRIEDASSEELERIMVMMKDASISNKQMQSAVHSDAKMESLRADLMEQFFEWDDLGKEHALRLFERQVDLGQCTAEQMELVLHHLSEQKDFASTERYASVGRSLGLLPAENYFPKKFRLFRGIHSISTLLLFASIPPALFGM